MMSEYVMTNEELAKAIADTISFIRSSHHTHDRYKPLHNHLDNLLLFQSTRASLVSYTDNNDLDDEWADYSEQLKAKIDLARATNV